jgi:DNA-binding response OmpR family regulator
MKMESVKKSILCVEDNQDNLELMTYLFESNNFKVTACNSLEGCLFQVRQNRFSAIILDNRFGNRSSVEVCDEIRSFNSNAPIIFYSGEAREDEKQKAIEACADAYLVKPNDFDKLTETVNKLIEESGL